LDSGVAAGKAISPYYDPMIAKLIAYGNDRKQALGRLTAGLARLHVEGVTSNAGFLSRLLRSQAFATAQLDTGLVERDLAALLEQPAPEESAVILAALAFAGALPTATQRVDPGKADPWRADPWRADPWQADPWQADPWQALGHWRALASAKQSVTLDCHGQEMLVQLDLASSGLRVSGRAQLDAGDWQDFALTASAAGGYALERAGRIKRYDLDQQAKAWRVLDAGEAYLFQQPAGWQSQDQADSSDALIAPMPGLVQQVLVAAGAQVEAGQVLAILEAMKMEHSLKAPRAAVIASVAVSAGAQVSDGQLLIQLEPEGEQA
jgi:3-methylcrotonyl-CoA carboxylase alpha subunit